MRAEYARGALLRENMIINGTVVYDSFRRHIVSGRLGKLQVVTAVDFSID